ncbi:MAG: ABC transporter substrate-binding protein [Planctomycetes bacterium]|nr:ABC transporter substrate-binding protein [Planctomycetota bacterium]
MPASGVGRRAFLTGLALLAACAPPPPVAARGPWSRPLAERSRDPWPRRIALPDSPETVIAAAPRRVVSATLLSDCLLLAIGPGEGVQALHAISIDPAFSPVVAESRRFPRHVKGDPEGILALRPDLVFVASYSRAETQELLAKGGASLVRMTDFASVADIQDNLRLVGYALGRDAEAEGVVMAMQATLDAVARGRERRGRWRLLHWGDGATSGAGTTFASLLESVGARNAAADAGLTGSVPLRAERLLALDPDVLVVGAVSGEEERVRERLRQEPALASLRALREGRLLLVENALLVAVSQHAALAAQEIARQLDRWQDERGK